MLEGSLLVDMVIGKHRWEMRKTKSRFGKGCGGKGKEEMRITSKQEEIRQC